MDRAIRRQERVRGHGRGEEVAPHPSVRRCVSCKVSHSRSAHRDHAVDVAALPPQFQKLLRGAPLLHREDIQDGDVILPYARNISYGAITGQPVKKANRKNLVIEVDVRFAPDGPWHHQVHNVPRDHVVGVVRGDAKYRVV